MTGLPSGNLGTVLAAGMPTEREDDSVIYFVDCGDYTPDTVCEAYGVDVVTGYQWGIVDVEEEYPAQPGAGLF